MSLSDYPARLPAAATPAPQGAVVAGEPLGAASALARLGAAPHLICHSAFFIERNSTVELGTVLVRGGGGPAVLLPDAASATFESLSVSGGAEQPLYAECDAGAKVTVKRLESTVQPLDSRCVSRQ